MFRKLISLKSDYLKIYLLAILGFKLYVSAHRPNHLGKDKYLRFRFIQKDQRIKYTFLKCNTQSQALKCCFDFRSDQNVNFIDRIIAMQNYDTHFDDSGNVKIIDIKISFDNKLFDS